MISEMIAEADPGFPIGGGTSPLGGRGANIQFPKTFQKTA